MKYDVRHKPTFATVFVTLQPGEQIVAEAGAMASMDGDVTIETQFSGGFVPALLKAFLGGESMFINTFTNKGNKPQEVVLTQSTIGDITRIELKGRELWLRVGGKVHGPSTRFG